MDSTSEATTLDDVLNGDGHAGREHNRGSAERSDGRARGQIHEAVEASVWTERAWWMLAGFLLIDWAVRLQGASVSFGFVGLVVLLLGVCGLICIVQAAVVSPAEGVRRWDLDYGWLVLVAFLVAYGVYAFIEIHNSPGLGTDEIAFNQYAARLASKGINPYGHSMAPAFPLYGVSPNGWTYHLNGTPVTSLSYPALSFLLYVPFMWMGWTTEVATAMNMAAWGVAIVILFALLPARVRPAALLLGTIATFLNYAFGGVTDFLYIPFLLLAVYRWDRFVTERGWKSYLGPVCMGLAMASKQTPWLIFPFLLIGIALEAWSRSGRRSAVVAAARYTGIAFAAFIIPNIPFVVLSPAAWLRGILTPVEGSLVPAGQGPIGLTLFMHLGGGSLLAYTVMEVFAFLALLALFIATYPRLRPMIAVTPAVVLFFSSRSFGSYLVVTLPALLLAVVSTERMPLVHSSEDKPEATAGALARPRFAIPRKAQRMVAALSVLGLAAIALVTYSSAPPLRIAINGVRTTGSLSTVQGVSITATNTSSRTIRPRFTVSQNGGAITTFWRQDSGPAALKPGQTASYQLAARNIAAQLPITGYFDVVAYSEHPNTVSVSDTYVPHNMHVLITPNVENTPFAVGKTVVLHAEVLDEYDRSVGRAGIPVYLGQIIYGQGGIQNSDVIVNGSPPGTSPVMALTDRRGVATFTLVGTSAHLDPVSFQSNLRNGSNGYPYGYSEIVMVAFKK